MAKFSLELVKKGKLAVHPVDLELFDGEIFKLGVRPLDSDEEIEAERKAREYAKAKGCESFAETDEIFMRAKAAHRLAIACVDVDAIGEPAFSGGATDILPLGDERIGYLIAEQREWQALVAPGMRAVDGVSLSNFIDEVAAGEATNPRPFLQLRPVTRWLFVHTMAKELASSRKPKSTSGGGSPTPN